MVLVLFGGWYYTVGSLSVCYHLCQPFLNAIII